jgi:hypothetical protein
MAFSWVLGKRSSTRGRSLGWAAAALLLPAMAAAQVAPPTINYECPSCPGHPRTWTALAEVGLVQVAVNWFGHYILEDSSQAVTLKAGGRTSRRLGIRCQPLQHQPVRPSLQWEHQLQRGPGQPRLLAVDSVRGTWKPDLGVPGRDSSSSLNDYISTTVGGVALGELTWQLSNMVLDNTPTGSNRFWKEMAGMGINPARGTSPTSWWTGSTPWTLPTGATSAS